MCHTYLIALLHESHRNFTSTAYHSRKTAAGYGMHKLRMQRYKNILNYANYSATFCDFCAEIFIFYPKCPKSAYPICQSYHLHTGETIRATLPNTREHL